MVDHFGATPKGRKNRRRAEEGRGTGHGPRYKPQLKVQDVPSRGRSSRIPLDGRIAHALSDLETRLIMEFRWSPYISDIREQVPLPLERTLAIAEEMGIAHPVIPGDGAPVVFTTDLVGHFDDGRTSVLCARSVKPSSALEISPVTKPRTARSRMATLASLEVERRYWQEQGADWRLVCEHDLDRTRAANIQLLLSCGDLDPGFGPMFWDDALSLVRAVLKRGEDYTLQELGSELSAKGKLSQRHFMECVRHLCAARALTFDMTRHFGPALRACDFQWRTA